MAIACRDVDQIIQPAVSFLPVLEAVLRRNVAVSRVEPSGKIGALPDIFDAGFSDNEIDAALPVMTWNVEFAERSRSVVIQRNLSCIRVARLRHQRSDRAVGRSLRFYVRDKREFEALNVDRCYLPNDLHRFIHHRVSRHYEVTKRCNVFAGPIDIRVIFHGIVYRCQSGHVIRHGVRA